METTWERPTNSPGTPKSPLPQKNSIPAVNGYHTSGSPLHQPDQPHPSLRKPSSDLQLVTLPFWVSYLQKEHRWDFGEAACNIVGFIFYVNLYASVVFMCLVAIDRYIGIVHPLTCRRFRTAKSAVAASFGVWLVSFLYCLFGLLPTVYYERQMCMEVYPVGHRYAVFKIGTIVFGFLLPCFILGFVNCVTFPHPSTMPEQELLKPGEWSYCDYFWDDKKDPQGNTSVSGFEILLQKQLKGKQMQKEIAEFIRERIKIEEEYAKSLSKLSQISLAAQEEGTLGEAWAQLKKSLADEAEVHLKFSSKLQSEVEKPLLTFRDNFKKDMKKFDHHITDLRKQLSSRYAAVEKARKALTERQKDLEMKTQQLEIKLSNKTEEDIKKARRKSTQAGDELMRCVDLYNQAQSKWFEEMVTTTLELERLEVERVEMIRQHLCQYTQLRHETDMFNQSTVETVDQLLQKVEPAKDRELWVKEHKTGDIRPVDMDI
ncbi:Growth arrest-specific protein 7 [Acipenser ruthenus]|uniref:Growth arrest-specific protein 7 n=1 Tax=Acipenser ruthenus TaxID=7906 RepID=A0A662YMM9_ACIRT|nr:Growth arrest-specific protein 7 [Acipenser ruthenus]